MAADPIVDDVIAILDQEGAEGVSVGTLCREADRPDLIRTAQNFKHADQRERETEAALIAAQVPGETRAFLDLIADPRTDPLSHAALAEQVEVSLRTVAEYRPQLWEQCGRHRAEQLRHMDEDEVAAHRSTRQKVCDRLKVYRRRVPIDTDQGGRPPKSLEDYRKECAKLRRRIRRLERTITKRDNRIDKLRKTSDAKLVQALLRLVVGAVSPSALDELADSGVLPMRDVEPFPSDWARIEPMIEQKHAMIASHYRNRYKREVCGVSPATGISAEDELKMIDWINEQVEADPLWPEELGRR